MDQQTPTQVRDLLASSQCQPSTKSKPQSPTEKPEKLPQQRLDQLWVKMTELYGHRWTSSFGVSADPDHSWATVLGGLNKRQLANGLNAWWLEALSSTGHRLRMSSARCAWKSQASRP